MRGECLGQGWLFSSKLPWSGLRGRPICGVWRTKEALRKGSSEARQECAGADAHVHTSGWEIPPPASGEEWPCLPQAHISHLHKLP